MKNVMDKKLPKSKDPKKKTIPRIVIPFVILVVLLGVLLVLHTSGSYALDAGEIDKSYVADNKQPTDHISNENTDPVVAESEVIDVTHVTEAITSTESEPVEESVPGMKDDPAIQPETTPETDALEPPEHTHIYIDSIIVPTCISKGYTLYACDCGHSYTDNELEQLPHSYTDQTISPTTESQGYTLHVCSSCGHQYKDNYTDPVPATEPPVDDVQPPASEPEVEEEHPDEDYGFCPVCGRRLWTSWYPSGCFTYLQDTVCSCGQLVHAMQCHHH